MMPHPERGTPSKEARHGQEPSAAALGILLPERAVRRVREKGTVWYLSRLPPEKALAISRHLAEGDGIRKTGRLVGATQETVIRLNRMLGEHGKALHEEKVRGVRVREAQADEMWSFVGKKREAVRPKQPR